MSEFTKKTDGSAIISSSPFYGIKVAAYVNLTTRGPSDAFLVDNYSISLASPSAPGDSLETRFVICKSSPISRLLGTIGESKVALSIIQGFRRVSVIYSNIFRSLHNFAVHSNPHGLSIDILFLPNCVINSALLVGNPVPLIQPFVIPSINNGDLTPCKWNVTNGWIGRLLNFGTVNTHNKKSFQIPVLDCSVAQRRSLG